MVVGRSLVCLLFLVGGLISGSISQVAPGHPWWLHTAFLVPNVAPWDGCCHGRPRAPSGCGFISVAVDVSSIQAVLRWQDR